MIKTLKGVENIMAHNSHFFLAVSLPKPTKGVLSRWKELMEPHLSFRSWVHPQDYHITLAFLGNASFAQVKAVKEKMNDILINYPVFNLELTGLGIFGNSEAPRVLWCGVKEDQNLIDLQKEVYEACTEIGFSLDKRPFHPHITIARKWIGEQNFEEKVLEQLGQPKDEFQVFKAELLVLYQTHMNRSPKYQPLTIFPLMR